MRAGLEYFREVVPRGRIDVGHLARQHLPRVRRRSLQPGVLQSALVADRREGVQVGVEQTQYQSLHDRRGQLGQSAPTIPQVPQPTVQWLVVLVAALLEKRVDVRAFVMGHHGIGLSHQQLNAANDLLPAPLALQFVASRRTQRRQAATILAHVEKDRTGVLAGSTIEWPTFDKLAKPLLGLLGSKHAPVPSDDEVALRDGEALERQEEERLQRSAEVATDYAARIAEAGTSDELRQVGRQLTPDVKARLTARDLERVRNLYGKRLDGLRATPASNGTP
jgi:hypothetical protein